MTLKVGDRVRFLENYNPESGPRYVRQASTGLVRKTRAGHLGGLLLTVDVDEGPRGVTVYGHRVEKIEDPTPKFKVGDRALSGDTPVTVTDPAYKTGHLVYVRAKFDIPSWGYGLWKESELTKIESVPFKLERGDKVVNRKSGREGEVIGGQVWDTKVWTSVGVPVKAIEEYEEHHPGTYDLIKKDAPW